MRHDFWPTARIQLLKAGSLGACSVLQTRGSFSDFGLSGTSFRTFVKHQRIKSFEGVQNVSSTVEFLDWGGRVKKEVVR